MCIDMGIGMCEEKAAAVFCTGMCMDMCIDMCMDICMDMCMEISFLKL